MFDLWVAVTIQRSSVWKDSCVWKDSSVWKDSCAFTEVAYIACWIMWMLSDSCSVTAAQWQPYWLLFQWLLICSHKLCLMESLCLNCLNHSQSSIYVITWQRKPYSFSCHIIYNIINILSDVVRSRSQNQETVSEHNSKYKVKEAVICCTQCVIYCKAGEEQAGCWPCVVQPLTPLTHWANWSSCNDLLTVEVHHDITAVM